MALTTLSPRLPTAQNQEWRVKPRPGGGTLRHIKKHPRKKPGPSYKKDIYGDILGNLTLTQNLLRTLTVCWSGALASCPENHRYPDCDYGVNVDKGAWDAFAAATPMLMRDGSHKKRTGWQWFVQSVCAAQLGTGGWRPYGPWPPYCINDLGLWEPPSEYAPDLITDISAAIASDGQLVVYTVPNLWPGYPNDATNITWPSAWVCCSWPVNTPSKRPSRNLWYCGCDDGTGTPPPGLAPSWRFANPPWTDQSPWWTPGPFRIQIQFLYSHCPWSLFYTPDDPNFRGWCSVYTGEYSGPPHAKLVHLT
jgi:hypothetical protein